MGNTKQSDMEISIIALTNNLKQTKTHPTFGSPSLMVPSALQTMSFLASPANCAIHPILPRKKQPMMKNKISAG